jgi:hypothetical protein
MSTRAVIVYEVIAIIQEHVHVDCVDCAKGKPLIAKDDGYWHYHEYLDRLVECEAGMLNGIIKTIKERVL